MHDLGVGVVLVPCVNKFLFLCLVICGAVNKPYFSLLWLGF